MRVKLSELKNDDILLVGDNLIISKEDYLEEKQDHVGETVYTTIQCMASINARDMLEVALENEADNMYEDWYEKVMEDITESDINELQAIVDRLLDGMSNISYCSDKEVEID